MFELKVKEYSCKHCARIFTYRHHQSEVRCPFCKSGKLEIRKKKGKK